MIQYTLFLTFIQHSVNRQEIIEINIMDYAKITSINLMVIIVFYNTNYKLDIINEFDV